jgi:hypothetical protein
MHEHTPTGELNIDYTLGTGTTSQILTFEIGIRFGSRNKMVDEIISGFTKCWMV